MDKARNEMLTRVGPGTPMGELLRRYWHPIAGASELGKEPDQANPADGRRDPRSLPGLERPLWIARPALSAPARRSVLWLCGKGRHSLQLPWLADG